MRMFCLTSEEMSFVDAFTRQSWKYVSSRKSQHRYFVLAWTAIGEPAKSRGMGSLHSFILLYFSVSMMKVKLKLSKEERN